ncbi:MAG: hypothetical protein HWQ38_30370 [Nostoc sp. NMS7]|uniref:hypothetical protein n=1 Tax=Nostoc sp. NMS7 TaxID=2815391 RepID=UPI0025FA06CD|nr:hypothetical protein [Nostoc sp. NMS7]MBN3950542.1 hypothetical protein [Nostoc sp. NMS7]
MPKRQKQNYDYAQQPKTPTIDNQAMPSLRDAPRTAGYAYANHKTRFINPSSFCPRKYYKQLGLRDRILKLSLMVAAVLSI